MMNQTATLDSYIRALPREALTDDELRRLCSAIRAAAEVGRGQTCAETEEAALRVGRDAEISLIRANLRLVVTFARPYRSSGVPLDDLIQAGNMGLVRAARRFDERKGFRFSTYAHYWIAASISDTLRGSQHLVRLPRELDAELGWYRRGHPPIDKDRIRWLESLANVCSLDQTLPSGEPFHDPDGDAHPDVEALTSVLVRDLDSALAALDARSKEILTLRYGLGGQAPWKAKDLARRYGLTRERIRQIHNAALEQLRNDATISAMRCWLR